MSDGDENTTGEVTGARGAATWTIYQQIPGPDNAWSWSWHSAKQRGRGISPTRDRALRDVQDAAGRAVR